MNKVNIHKSPLCGNIILPPSKSIMHRAIISAALAEGESRVSPVILSDDIRRTIDAVCALGARVTIKDGCALVRGIETAADKAEIYCGESGSTLRFMIPVAAALGTSAEFTGSGLLPSRPLSVFTNTLPQFGVGFTSDKLPLTVNGRLTPGDYLLDGSVSSQFITGLMFALPMLKGDSTIRFSSPLQSSSYVDITLSVLKDFGIEIEKRGDDYIIFGNQSYTPCDYTVESDWSHSVFYIMSAMIDGEISLNGLFEHSVQGDSAVLEIVRQMGADISFDSRTLNCRRGNLRGTVIDASDIPDLIPALAAAAALADGTTEIINAGRLRIKECDRLTATSQGLTALGADVTELSDGLIINGGRPLYGGEINGYGDHRIVMAFACLGSHIGDVVISDAGAVSKSYPGFFEDFKSLGGKYNVI